MGESWRCVAGEANLISEWPFDQEATDAQVASAQAFVDDTLAYAEKYKDIEVAEADGYDWYDLPNLVEYLEGSEEGEELKESLRTGTVVHVVNEELSNDGIAADPTKPDVLIYATDSSKYVLVGVMFMAPADEHGPQMGGPLTVWHTHGAIPLCWLGSAAVDFAGPGTPDAPLEPPRECSRGTLLSESPEMLHVWYDRSSLEDTFSAAMGDREAASVVDG